VIVFKVGGSLDGAYKRGLVDAILLCREQGEQLAIVHGGGPAISRALENHRITWVFEQGQRLTPPEAMPLVESVLNSEVNGAIVECLRQEGLPVLGMSGADDIVFGEPVFKGMCTGRIHHIDPTPVLRVMERGDIPVVSPIGTDASQGRLNINADAVAGALAGALGADRLVFLTDVDGIYRDWDTKVLLTQTTKSELERLLHDGVFTQGMIPKVKSILSALQAGVKSVYVVHGGKPDHVLWSVMPSSGAKTKYALGTYVLSEEVS
jgi:acetylglutamate kinase